MESTSEEERCVRCGLKHPLDDDSIAKYCRAVKSVSYHPVVYSDMKVVINTISQIEYVGPEAQKELIDHAIDGAFPK